MRNQLELYNPEDFPKSDKTYYLSYPADHAAPHDHYSTFKLLNMSEQLYHKQKQASLLTTRPKKTTKNSNTTFICERDNSQNRNANYLNYLMEDRFVPSRKIINEQFCTTTSNPDNIYSQGNLDEEFLGEQDPQTITVAEIYSRELLRKNNMHKNLRKFSHGRTKEHKNAYDQGIDLELFSNRNLFRYKIKYNKDPLNGTYICPNLPVLHLKKAHSYKKNRKIPKNPFKVLDAPALTDDFYLNLIAWSNKNMLAVGLGNCIYLWDAVTTKVTRLCELQNDIITSVCWSDDSPKLAIGCNRGHVLVWDVNHEKQIRKMQGHEIRVGAMSWSKKFLSTGSRDKTILQRDINEPKNYVTKLQEHSQEICGLKWSRDEQYLASGGNDNKVIIWNQNGQAINKFNDHRAAVKALAWSPHKHGLLATGGGTADRMIKLRNIFTSETIFSEDTGSQVCNLQFSKSMHELVSTHGYSQNQINIWQYPNLKRIATLKGHTHRVLYLAISPDGSQIVTGAGDETLRFWNVFPKINQHSDKIDSTLEFGQYDVR